MWDPKAGLCWRVSVRSLPEVSASLPVQRDDSHPIHARPGATHFARWCEVVAVSVGVSDTVCIFELRPEEHMAHSTCSPGWWQHADVPFVGNFSISLAIIIQTALEVPQLTLTTALPAGTINPFHR